MLRSEKEIRKKIEEIKKTYHHVLFVGGPSDISINTPRALMQIEGENKLTTLYWVLGETYIHRYPKERNQ